MKNQSTLTNALASIKIPAQARTLPTTSHIQNEEKIFPEPQVERVTVFLFAEDITEIDKFLAAAKTSGRRKVNQSQAIRALIRTGSFKTDVLDKVLGEDGRRKAK